MERNNKQHLCIGLFLFVTVTCLLLCHFSFKEVIGSQQPGSQMALAESDNVNDVMTGETSLVSLQTTIIDAQSSRILSPSGVKLRASFGFKSRDGQFRKLFNHIFSVLFKTVCIPTFVFAIMGNCLHAQPSLLQFILRYIQNQDGKKQTA